jgi:capsular exopolysaccharide synthesis family protein
MSTSEPILLAPAEGSPPGNEADPGRMLQILWRGKWILLLVPLFAFVCARVWLDAETKLYVATAQVQVDARAVNVLKSGAGEAIAKPRTVLKQQQGLLKSTLLLKRIADAPGLADMKTFAPERLGDQTLMGALYDDLQTGLDVESDRLFLYFYSPFREEAVTVLDEALRVYIEYHKEKKKEEASGLAAIVRTEWEAAKRELEEASQAIAALQAENTMLAGTDRTQLQTKLEGANAALGQAHLETQRLKAVFEDMQATSRDAARFRERGLYWRAKGPIAALEERLGALQKSRESKEAELRRLEQRGIGSGHERFAELKAELAEIAGQEDAVTLQYAQDYLRNSEVDHQRARLYEQGLADDVQALLGQVTRENQVLDRIKDLQITRDQLRERVAGFDQRITELELQNQTGALNLDVIEYPRASVRPAYPDEEKVLVYALGASFIAAFGLVLLVGLSDRRVRAVEDVPRLLGTSVLGVLPELPGGSDRVKIARMVEEDPDSLVAEALRSVRTATTFALPGGRGLVLVTSASSGEGKSVCASNLAFALARAGKKTLLVDADMRKPAQHEIYSVANGTGLAGLLSSSAPLRKAVVSNVAMGLDLLPAGDPYGRAAELCEGLVLGGLMQTLRESYECVVVDSPPVLETSEARVLATLADAVVFVLRLDVSRAPNLKRAAGILRGVGARILGALPNGAASQRGARAYAGGISYGQAPARTITGARPRGATDEGETDVREARARGTDFLGLEEESA